jgi:hypothetical protein
MAILRDQTLASARRTRLGAFGSSSLGVVLALSLVTPGLGAGASVPAKPSHVATKARPLTHADLNGYWHVTNFHSHIEPLDTRITRTVEGELTPLLPAAQAVYDKRLDDARNGSAFADTLSYCITSGPWMMRGPSYPIFIDQPKGMVVILFEVLHNVRWVYLGAKHPPEDQLDNNYQGDSVGHWEGDTLVIDTVGFNDKTTLDKVGLPHSDALHMIEHIRLTGPNNFEEIITYDDPKTFSRPFSVKATYERMKPGTRIMENVCDNNRNRPTADGKVGLQDPSAP